MASLDSFKCRKTLTVGAKTYEIYSLKAAEKNGLAGVSRLPFSLKIVLENLLRNEDGRTRQEGRHRGGRGVDRQSRQGRARNRLPPGARADAGLHRRAGGGRSRRDARRDGRARRRSGQDQSAGSGRPRHRPFGRRRLFRHRQVARPERGARIRAEPGALSVPEMGPAGLLQLSRRAARHRHLPPGQSRISRPDRLDGEREAQRQDGRSRLSRHAGRHRQPHDDGQRPRRSWLGRRGHRGRSRHARPAPVDAAARGDRLQARGRIARRA